MGTQTQDGSPFTFSLKLCEADYTDIPALSSVFSKSFHPVSSFMKQAIPDTLQISQWWNEVNLFALNDPQTRIMKVVDTAAEGRIVALARWGLPAGEKVMAVGAGCWCTVPLTADHDEALCDAFIGFMAECRREVMQDRPHYCKSQLIRYF